jgi:undecaprenyl-diphosphatase
MPRAVQPPTAFAPVDPTAGTPRRHGPAAAPVDRFEAPDGSWPDHFGERLQGWHPAVAAGAVAIASWAALSVALVALGLVLTNRLLDGPLGAWDLDVNVWLAERRTGLWNDLSAIGSKFSDTLVIITATAIAALVLVVRRHWRDALFIVLAPTIEVTAFLVATFVVDRDRPAVERLDSAPPTSSFPSGHVAAAVAFYVALAIVTSNRVRSVVVVAAAWMVAAVVPLCVLGSRVYRGMHFPTDVIVGYVAGWVCVAMALLAVRTASAVAARRSSLARPA